MEYRSIQSIKLCLEYISIKEGSQFVNISFTTKDFSLRRIDNEKRPEN